MATKLSLQFHAAPDELLHELLPSWTRGLDLFSAYETFLPHYAGTAFELPSTDSVPGRLMEEIQNASLREREEESGRPLGRDAAKPRNVPARAAPSIGVRSYPLPK
jgi:hypothetical protein